MKNRQIFKIYLTKELLQTGVEKKIYGFSNYNNVVEEKQDGVCMKMKGCITVSLWQCDGC